MVRLVACFLAVCAQPIPGSRRCNEMASVSVGSHRTMKKEDRSVKCGQGNNTEERPGTHRPHNFTLIQSPATKLRFRRENSVLR